MERDPGALIHQRNHLGDVGAPELDPQPEARDVTGGDETGGEHAHPTIPVRVARRAVAESGHLVASQLPLPARVPVRSNQDAGIGFLGIVVSDPDTGHVLVTVRLVAVCAEDDSGCFSSELPDIPHAAVGEEGGGAVSIQALGLAASHLRPFCALQHVTTATQQKIRPVPGSSRRALEGIGGNCGGRARALTRGVVLEIRSNELMSRLREGRVTLCDPACPTTAQTRVG